MSDEHRTYGPNEQFAKADHYFTDFNEYGNLKFLGERDRIVDVRDPKWAHPELTDNWCAPTNATSAAMYNPDLSFEERVKNAEEMTDGMLAMFNELMSTGNGGESNCDVQSYTVPGCVEEPDKEVEVLVYRPKSVTSKHARTLLYLLGGALVLREPKMFPIEDMCEQHKCIAIVPLYRRSWEAEYPAAINDIHAAYAWMYDHAEEIGANTDNVVIYGQSSGGHLACSAAFRLKRYGYRPKGIVADIPQTDERQGIGPGDFVYTGMWDVLNGHDAAMQYLGRNFGMTSTGPEAYANHATVEDCIGYPPLFMHAVEFDSDTDANRKFYEKVLAAHSYTEFHCWGGAYHGAFSVVDCDYTRRYREILNGNIDDCFQYDLRRPWVEESRLDKMEDELRQKGRLN
jgi:acetyl esterase/lipase